MRPPLSGLIPIRDGPDLSLLHRLDRCAVVPIENVLSFVRSPRAKRWRLDATLPWSIVRHSQHKPVRGPGGRARMLTGERTIPIIEIPTQSDPIRIGCRAGSNFPVAPPFNGGPMASEKFDPVFACTFLRLPVAPARRTSSLHYVLGADVLKIASAPSRCCVSANNQGVAVSGPCGTSVARATRRRHLSGERYELASH